MNLTVREMQIGDIEKKVNYFVDADIDFLRGMGAEKSKLPKREEWINILKHELSRPYTEKEFYYIIWLLDGEAIGHSNVNNIQYGKDATMHLHLWNSTKRQSGLGLQFLKLTIPLYFEHLALKKIICEPYAKNIAPNKTLRKLGFEFIRAYDTTPGWINFHQTVNRYELTKENWKRFIF